MHFVNRVNLEASEVALSDAEFKRQWPLPVQVGGVWYAGPGNSFGYITSPTKEGAEKSRQAVYRATVLVAKRRGPIWC
jgi:hypothetical protein